jgi:hypothetical protein
MCIYTCSILNGFQNKEKSFSSRITCVFVAKPITNGSAYENTDSSSYKHKSHCQTRCSTVNMCHGRSERLERSNAKWKCCNLGDLQNPKLLYSLWKSESVAARNGPHNDDPISHFTQEIPGIKRHSYKFLGVCVCQLQMLFTSLQKNYKNSQRNMIKIYRHICS